MKILPKYIELETKDCLVLTCIFAATGHVIAALVCLVLFLISAHNNQKKANAAEVKAVKAIQPELWDRDDIQFPRLIAEMVAIGVPNHSEILELADAMDLDSHEVDMLLDRAQTRWEEIKKETCP